MTAWIRSRFEHAAFHAAAPPHRVLATDCSLREALGSEVLVHFPVEAAAEAAADAVVQPLGDTSSTFVARVDPQTTARVGEPLQLVVNTARLHFFDPGTGLAIDG